MMTKVEKLLTSSQNIFTTQDLATIWGISEKKSLYDSIKYYLRKGSLKRIHKGIYSIKKFTSFEVSQKIITPSYISFYTALAFHGISFQLDTSIHSMALKSKKLSVNNEQYVYHKLKDAVFFDSLGVKDMTTHYIAGPERAVCDSLYLVPELAFDNLKMIDFNLLRKTSKIYGSSRLELEVEKIVTVKEL